MWSLLFPRYDDDLVTTLWEAGTAGILEEADGLRAYFADDVAPETLAHLDGEFRVENQQQAICNPEDWQPIEVGERFFIVPASFDGAVPHSRLLLRLQTGAAFGTGRHETTQLCLEAMERYLRASDTVLDAGCGSGILSAAAHLLGARRIYSCDIDPDAIELTRRHVSTPVFLGSADAIAAQSMDLVLANLTAPILDRLAWDLRRITKPGGLLLLTGFWRERLPQNFAPRQQFERNQWLCWICSPQQITALPPARDGLTHEVDWWL